MKLEYNQLATGVMEVIYNNKRLCICSHYLHGWALVPAASGHPVMYDHNLERLVWRFLENPGVSHY